MKTGRNDPCPCGSGKKYKQCCLRKQAAVSPAELSWRRIRRELEGSPTRMLHFIKQAYGAVALVEAWEQFTLHSEEPFDPESPHMTVFMPWFLHRWSPDPGKTDVADSQLHGVVPGQTYLARKGRQLAPILEQYLRSCLDSPYSFFEIEQVEAGHSVAVRDLISGEHHEVLERAASHQLQPHDMVYAQLAHVEDITLFEGLCETVFPPGDKVKVIELRKPMRANASDPESRHDLAAQDTVLRSMYFSLINRQFLRSLPELVTSEGDPVEFHHLVYAIDSAQRAFDALKHLDAIADDPDHELQHDADGVLRHAHIEWGEMDQGEDAESGLLLGSIDIDGTTLTAQTRSRQRAERLQAIIQAKLGNHASFRTDSIQTVEQMMANTPPPSPRSPAPPDEPEVLKIKTDYLRRHYSTWMDTPLPALDHRTPRQVTQTADGCEAVQALLHDAQRGNIGLPPALCAPIFDDIRQQLGITD